VLGSFGTISSSAAAVVKRVAGVRRELQRLGIVAHRLGVLALGRVAGAALIERQRQLAPLRAEGVDQPGAGVDLGLRQVRLGAGLAHLLRLAVVGLGKGRKRRRQCE
jgi:hypothetical protein